MLAQRLSLLAGSGTAAAREAAKAAAAKGREIVDLAAGEVIIDPPATVREGAIKAINAGTNRYTESVGLTPLREAVAKKISAETRLDWQTENIVITAGAKQGLLDAALALVNPGDEVIIVRPCWPTFPSQILLVGAKPVFVDAKAPDYVPNIEDIRSAVTPKTKAIIVNSPNNPTGAVYDRATLQAIGELAINYDLWIVSDECYSGFVFNGDEHQSIVMAHPGVRNRTIMVNAFSKELAITGWRLGYFAAPPEIVVQAKKLQSHTTSNANVIAQHAIMHHLDVSDGSYEREMHQRLVNARETGLRIFSQLSDVAPPRADGSFFFYLDLGPLLAKVPEGSPFKSADDVARVLLEETGVASVGGTTFGDPSGLRFSFGAPPDKIEPALTKVVAMLNSLTKKQAAA